MEIQEHFYADDPARGPAGGKTTLRDVEYFFLGNGLIQAAVQIAPTEGATPVGLLIMDPDRLGPKRAALSFDPDAGLAATALSLVDRGAVHAARAGSVRAGWLRGSRDPRVEVVWRSGPYRVREIFFCPDMKKARLLRVVTVTRSGAGASKVRLKTGLRGRTIDAELIFRGSAAAPVVLEYRLTERDGKPGIRTKTAEKAHDAYEDWILPLWQDNAIPTVNPEFTACVECHKDYATQRRFSVYMNHPLHAELGMRCVECHPTNPHPNPPRPQENACADCHSEVNDKDQCGYCHPPASLPHFYYLGTPKESVVDCSVCHPKNSFAGQPPDPKITSVGFTGSNEATCRGGRRASSRAASCAPMPISSVSMPSRS